MNLFPRPDDFEITPFFAQRALLYGIGLGVLGSLLFLEIQSPGLPLTIWLTSFATAAISLAARSRVESVRLIACWSLLAIGSATLLIVRHNPVAFLSLVAMILLAAVIVVMELRGTKLRNVTPFAFLASCSRLPLQSLTACFSLFGKVDFRGNANDPKLFAVLRGLVIALPLVLLFGALFSSADAGFENAFARVLEFFGPDMPEHILVSFCIGWLATGLLTAICSRDATDDSSQSTRLLIGAIETRIVMSLLLALFALFILLQLPYLFGGRDTIESASGLTLAGYARRGFFELVTVTGISLVVLVSLNTTTANKAQFKPLAIALLGCLLLVVISAAQRLYLYMDSFGLTLSRLSAAMFMGWLGLCLMLFAICLLRNSERGLIPGAIYSGIAFVLALNLISPPLLVANYNLAHARSSETPLDIDYLTTLGVEVVPLLVAEFDALDPGQQCRLAWEWTEEFNLRDEDAEASTDWRNWNLAQERARRSVIAIKEDLPTLVQHRPRNGPMPGFRPFSFACQHATVLFRLMPANQ